MQRNKKQQGLHFEVFKKEGKYGSIKKADFLTKKKKVSNEKGGKLVHPEEYPP